jgi:hypothetical protein
MLKSLFVASMLIIGSSLPTFADDCAAACHAQYLSTMRSCTTVQTTACNMAPAEKARCQDACPRSPPSNRAIR